MALADVNGDGKIDLVFSGSPLGGEHDPAGVGVCFGNGDGTFASPVFYQLGNDSGFGSVIVGDFTGDGIPDIVAVGTSGIWLFTGQGDGLFNPGQLTPVTNIPLGP